MQQNVYSTGLMDCFKLKHSEQFQQTIKGEYFSYVFHKTLSLAFRENCLYSCILTDSFNTTSKPILFDYKKKYYKMLRDKM